MDGGEAKEIKESRINKVAITGCNNFSCNVQKASVGVRVGVVEGACRVLGKGRLVRGRTDSSNRVTSCSSGHNKNHQWQKIRRIRTHCGRAS